MKSMRAFLTGLAVAAALSGGAADATVLFDTTSAVTATNSKTQIGRLSRNSVQQDWAGGETFPGIINPTISYFYTTYVIAVGLTNYIQVDFDSLSANTFVSAYQTAYLPNPTATNRGLDVNWLGDAGSSANFFSGTDPLFFNVVANINSFLVVVVNTTGANGLGLTDPFHLTVEGYIDSSFDEPAAVPEPSTLWLAFAPLAFVAVRRAAKGRRSAPALAAA